MANRIRRPDGHTRKSQFATYLTQPTQDRLRDYAIHTKVSISELIEKAITHYLDTVTEASAPGAKDPKAASVKPAPGGARKYAPQLLGPTT